MLHVYPPVSRIISLLLALLATAKVTGLALTSADHRRLIDEAIGELDFSLLEGKS